MHTSDAISYMIKISGKSRRAFSLDLGNSPWWAAAMVSNHRDSQAGTLSLIAKECGYTLACVPSSAVLPDGSLTIDPIQRDK